MNNRLLHQIALTFIPNIGAVQAKILVEHFGDAESIFRASKKELESIDGIGVVRASSVKKFDNYKSAEEEINFIEKHRIQSFFLTDDTYPKRLLQCYDSPTILYYKGNADLNASKVVSIVGTRHSTDYGKQATEELIEQLQSMNVLIISGLAYGIDAVAHKAAVQNNLQTVGVLAHALDKIYPEKNASLAKQMMLNGGVITEFYSKADFIQQNFPRRNRVVAGMADATIVIETPVKGGSMITAELANGYNRDVFAYPGKTTDSKSAGCNHLIKTNKAMLLESGEQLIETMGWDVKPSKRKVQKELFISLSDDEETLVNLLKEKDLVHIDELYLKSGLTSSAVAAAMLNLEFQNVVASLPGKMYKLI